MESKIISQNLFLIVILSVAYPVLGQMDPNKKTTIVIDSGHGVKALAFSILNSLTTILDL